MRPMQRLALLLVAAAWCASAAAAAGGAREDDWQAPWFCHDLDCPKYTVLKNLTDIDAELRRYDAGLWASTRVTGVQYDKAVAAGFWRLFKYISGDNEEQRKVEMTAPVTVRVTPGAGPACEDDFTISFFVPFVFQSGPPKPSHPEVFIRSQPALEVFVRSFGGWATSASWLQQAASLTNDLEDAGHGVDAEHFFTAGYDSPFRLRRRHNEVWIPAAAEQGRGAGGGGGARAAEGVAAA